MSDIICVPLTVSRTGRTEEKRQRQSRDKDKSERRQEYKKKKKKRGEGLRLKELDDGQADGVMEDDRSEA